MATTLSYLDLVTNQPIILFVNFLTGKQTTEATLATSGHPVPCPCFLLLASWKLKCHSTEEEVSILKEVLQQVILMFYINVFILTIFYINVSINFSETTFYDHHIFLNKLMESLQCDWLNYCTLLAISQCTGDRRWPSLKWTTLGHSLLTAK